MAGGAAAAADDVKKTKKKPKRKDTFSELCNEKKTSGDTVIEVGNMLQSATDSIDHGLSVVRSINSCSIDRVIYIRCQSDL